MCLGGIFSVVSCASAPPPAPVEPRAFTGKLPFGEVQRGLLPAKEQARRCFAQAVARDPKATGTVVVAFTIQPDGTVIGAIANSETSLPDAQAAQCVVSAVSDSDFPRATQASSIEYPFDGASDAAPVAAAIEEGVRKRYPALTQCYEAAVAKDKTYAGKLQVRFGIEPSGLVKKPRLSPSSELREPELVQCALRVFAGMLFPRSERGTETVEYPLQLAP